MYIADLHIHSHYSRATSRDCNLENLDLWARRKGIHLIGTGDFTHPAWREEMQEKLEPAEEGLYTLKKEYRIVDDSVADVMVPRFVITGEISSIYKKNDRVRKVHSLILLPGLEDAEILARKLEIIGNIHSDGRPILGLDCHDLLEIMLELCPGAIYVPAHIWTPHFSLFGAFSGFDSVEECFGDLSGYIHAMETGLSSDPPMNWRISALDKYQLISNSDAHSPAKLGREANLLDTGLSFSELREAIQTGKGLQGTIEFFPEEGKYHFDGHRKCGICLAPAETIKYDGICPVCGRKLTIGVSHRVEQLADRTEGYVRTDAKGFESLVPLPEVIGASLGHSAASTKVQKEYQNMLHRLGPEFEILRSVPEEDVQKTSGHLIAEGIRRLRAGKVVRNPGFDGEYGTVKLFTQDEIDSLDGQMSFFDALCINTEEKHGSESGKSGDKRQISDNGSEPLEGITGENISSGNQIAETKNAEGAAGPNKPEDLNQEQEQAVRALGSVVAVVAGPGTGKTKTLISRILYMLEVRKVKPSEITAVTFTNKAAGELMERIKKEIGRSRNLNKMQVGTFHAICLNFLKNQGVEFSLADDAASLEAAGRALDETGLKMKPKELLRVASLLKSGMDPEEMQTRMAQNDADDEAQEMPQNWNEGAKAYQRILREQHLLDFDDLLLETLKLIEQGSVQDGWEKRFAYLLVDEFQDISPIQYRLIQAWSRGGRELFVIGDPDQSIYGFRGSDARCFEKLKEDYPDMHEIRLAWNYRCVPAVLHAAASVISHNQGPERRLLAHRQEEMPVRVVRAGSEMAEAIFTAKEINRLAGGIGMLEAQEIGAGSGKVRGFGDIAVLYRTHRQADLLEKCLRKEGIPYVATGREAFLTEDEVRGSIFFFKCLANPADEFSRKICLKLLWDLDTNVVAESVFESMAEKFRPLYAKSKPQKFLEKWIEETQMQESTAMKKLAGMTLFYRSMDEFMEALSLGVESDLRRCGDRSYNGEAVTLMTLHGAKGLEFPVTFIYGVRKGLIPFEKYETVDMEEERRLFYVGMTRAKDELILTTSQDESEFLGELPDTGICRERADKRKNAGSGKQMSLFDFM